MKKGWKTKKLGEVCEFEGGSQPPKSQFIYEPRPGYVRFLQIRDFGSDKNITFIPESKKNRLCVEDDTLIGRYGASVGKILTGKAGAYNVALMKTVPNLGILQREWFHSYLLSDGFQERLMNVASRSAQDGFSKEDISNFPIPVPPLPEQQRIVGILDEAFGGLATAQAHAAQNLQNARDLFESHLNAVFTQRGDGWVEKTLGDVAQLKNGLNYNRDSKGQTLPVVGVGDFQSNNLVPVDQLQTVTIDGELSTDYSLQYGDVLTVRSNGSKDLVGRCMLVPKLSQTTSYSGFIIRIRVNMSEISPPFLLYFMKSSDTRDRLTRDGGGANISNINQTKLAALPLSLPPIAEQNKLVNQLDALSSETQRLTRIYEQKLAALSELKKSLLHQAFSGEL
ncbi:MAG: restriction endonuclease subunit S [Planctomycetaceae bacterium]|jgi:type I restriction enzyme S subunit|nr:restriction endonuclease subunit S [Planctomycetaceae bacterium]